MHKKILCDVCKEKIATVHYTEIVNNKLKKMDLCEDCAKQENIGINVQFSVADILKGLTGSKVIKKEEAGKRCPSCGLTFNQFRKAGKLGCGECYSAFEDELLPIIGDIHKNAQHVGSRPEKARRAKVATGTKAKLAEFTVQLETAVANEEYEEAAVLRDKIKDLQKKNDMKPENKRSKTDN